MLQIFSEPSAGLLVQIFLYDVSECRESPVRQEEVTQALDVAEMGVISFFSAGEAGWV